MLTVVSETLDDGTIQQYDNAHEETKGHERHVAPDPVPEPVAFPGIEELYERFWDEIPKPRSAHPPTLVLPMPHSMNVLLVTVDDDHDPYEAGIEAIQQFEAGQAIDQPATIRFANESQLTDVFNERTYTLLRTIRDETPGSIRETARLVGRDKKNVHEELMTLEALGVIRFEAD